MRKLNLSRLAAVEEQAAAASPDYCTCRWNSPGGMVAPNFGDDPLWQHQDEAGQLEAQRCPACGKPPYITVVYVTEWRKP